MSKLLQKNLPRISILIGAYNCAKTLSYSLDSILNQTYANYICYVCDDGSTDNTAEIIQKYSEKDCRIVFLKNESNMGLSKTLNKCFELVTTPYIARMDGDDIAKPNRLETQISFMELHQNIEICGSAVQYFDDNGFWGEHINQEYPENKDFLFVNPFAHPTIVMRTETAKKMSSLNNNELYTTNKKVGRSEDYDLFMRMYANGIKGYNFQFPLLEYRENRQAYSKRKFRYTLSESRVRLHGFKKLNLLPLGLIYVIKPIIIGLIPSSLRLNLRKKFYGNKNA